MAEEKKVENEMEEEELNLDDLENVAGGFSLRNAPKVQTTDISQDTIQRS